VELAVKVGCKTNEHLDTKQDVLSEEMQDSLWSP
jgi:hypothetical protein